MGPTPRHASRRAASGQPHCQRGGVEGGRALRQQAGNQAGEGVALAGGGHAGVASGGSVDNGRQGGQSGCRRL